MVWPKISMLKQSKLHPLLSPPYLSSLSISLSSLHISLLPPYLSPCPPYLSPPSISLPSLHLSPSLSYLESSFLHISSTLISLPCPPYLSPPFISLPSLHLSPPFLSRILISDIINLPPFLEVITVLYIYILSFIYYIFIYYIYYILSFIYYIFIYYIYYILSFIQLHSRAGVPAFHGTLRSTCWRGCGCGNFPGSRTPIPRVGGKENLPNHPTIWWNCSAVYSGKWTLTVCPPFPMQPT